MSERYTIEKGDWGLFFYDQKQNKSLSFEDVGDILNGIEELISEFANDLDSNMWIKDIKKKWEAKLYNGL